MIRTADDLLRWCQDCRATAGRVLELYESGKLAFRTNSVDAAERQKATLRRVAADMEMMIQRLRADA